MPQLWEVVGGAATGGILVREGRDLKSPEAAARLSTGAEVEELQLVLERLQYRLVTGTGPAEGWISISLKGKPLVQQKAPEAVELEAVEPGQHPATARCRREWARQTPPWKPIDMQTFMENYSKELPGMRYNLTFPHTPDLLTSSKYGASWLTKAFHAAGTLPLDNRVVKIVGTRPITGGGASLKAAIEVEYEKPSPELHTKLFMKYPYDYENRAQKSDRMNSSVMLQGMDVAEADAYRLLEASLPFPIPKYYFADISNVSTNFVLITELIRYGDRKKPRQDFAPGEVEPAYEKFLDDEQFDNSFEYYKVWTQALASMAGKYKTGQLGEDAKLMQFFSDSRQFLPQSGVSDAEFKVKLKMGEDFITSCAKHLFPPGVISDANIKEWKRILTIVNAYKKEIYHLASSNEDNMAVVHGNMNADNTWWWRDEDKKLHIGVLDWGGLSKVSLPQKLWWSYYASECHMLEDHLDELLQVFVETYEREGGPRLDVKEVRRDFMFAALDQCVGLLGAVPMIYKVIPKKSWVEGEVKDRHDQRLRDNFLTRMYVQGFVLIMTMICKFDLGKLCDELLAMPGMPAKPLADV
mmetsp:Transcript_17433/g.27861  ORF Transcript_17433/g.27861 Transcript_17433/m.27861 type:complete len:582 (+) Transcript_17433:154-1899(+)